MSKIEIITSVTGDKDWLIDKQERGKATFTAFVDKPHDTKLWHMKMAYDRFKDPRRNSRIHKILIHKYSKADITIWMDGNTYLLVPPEDIVEKYLGDCDMALFQHGSRDCIYDESLACAKLGLDDPEVIIEQAKYYEDNEYAKGKGLGSGYFIIRKNNKRTRAFNEAWWADYCRFSRRDQISLMPAIEASGISVNIIPEKWIQCAGYASMGGMVGIVHHKNFEGNFNDPKNV